MAGCTSTNVGPSVARSSAPRAPRADPGRSDVEARAIPRIADDVVARPRVIDALLGLVWRYPLVQVTAAAGAGKTTAVAQALETVDRPVAWLPLDEWHCSPGRLLDDLVAALEPCIPVLGRKIRHARASGADAVELAAIAGSIAHLGRLILVVDDCHVLRRSSEATAVIAALIRRSAPGLRVLLVGRTDLPLAGLGVAALDPGARLADDVLRANSEEADAILRQHGSAAEVGEALAATNGWVAGLVFESWRSRDPKSPGADALGEYLAREVRPRLAPDTAEHLVASSVFDEIDLRRAKAVGVEDVRSWLSALREAGVPAVWAPDGSAMRLHPRIREHLRMELRNGPPERLRAVATAAADVLEREGDLERAVELLLQAEVTTDDLQRLLPEAILAVVGRRDVTQAERYLAEVRLDPEPAAVVLARLTIASIRASSVDGCNVIDRVDRAGHLARLIADEPAIGAFASHFLAGSLRIAEAEDVLAVMPVGRAADVARLVLSLARDDPECPIPSFAGDALDSSIARLLYCRGRLVELRARRTEWVESTGAVEVSAPGTSLSRSFAAEGFPRVMARFSHALDLRDVATARACVGELGGVWALLSEAELAIRLERDPARAHAALERLRAGKGWTSVPFYRELADTWDGAAHLLADEPEAAVEVLREALSSMQRGDRKLAMASALVYLAEAQWRLGDEDASDRAADDAYEVAHGQGNLRGLLLSLADFPGVLSRRLDAEPAGEGVWHSLGRALFAGARRTAGGLVAPAAVHLREFGDPAIVVAGQVVRPKIKKSLELASYLIGSPASRVSREDVLRALWRGRDDDSTRAYLRQALRHLRDVLPEGVSVTSAGDTLSIEGAMTSESLELEALVAEAAREPGPRRLGVLLDALDIASRGTFLAGSNNVLWVDDCRSRIDSVVADIRLDAAELLLDMDQHVEAVSLVEEALAADPLLERGWRLRMRAQGLLGDADGVLAAYRECREALAEIGLEPSRTTTDLARTYRR